MDISLRARRIKLISDSLKLTNSTIWMPSISVKILPYYKSKPSGLFSNNNSGFNKYHGIPKCQNEIQQNRLVEVMLSFSVQPNAYRSNLLSFAKKVIYHKYKDILKENSHYVFVLRPSIIFLSPLDFRIQYYAAMNLANGFANPHKVKKLFHEETEFLFTQKTKENFYSGKYMTSDPFSDDLKVWSTFNDVWKINFSKNLTLNSIIAKTLIHSWTNSLQVLANNRKPSTQYINEGNKSLLSIRHLRGKERLLNSLSIIIERLNNKESELYISFENAKLYSKVSLVTIRRFWRNHDIQLELQRLLEYWVWELEEIDNICKFMEYIKMLISQELQ